MSKLFIHHPLFRLLSPVFSGIIAYLLILLLNNNVTQLQEHFLGEELYVSIGLSYIIQEFSRALLLFFNKYLGVNSSVLKQLFQITVAMGLCVVLVTSSITLYYTYVLGFSPNKEELYIFNSIFCSITLIYILLYISHYYLYKINTDKLNDELLLKQSIEEDFIQFKRGINPKLLFESFESLIALMRQDKEKTDDFIDHLAAIYRYILTSKTQQLVAVQEELTPLKELEHLLNYLPFKSISLNQQISSNFLIVPGSLLYILEQIVRRTITASSTNMNITISEDEDFLQLAYQPNDKITDAFQWKHLAEIERIYKIYGTQQVTLTEDGGYRTVRIPKLQPLA